MRDDWSEYLAEAMAKIARDVADKARESARNYIKLSNKELCGRIEGTALGRVN